MHITLYYDYYETINLPYGYWLTFRFIYYFIILWSKRFPTAPTLSSAGSSSSSAFPSSSWTSILPSQGIIGLQSPHFLYQDPNEGSGRVKRGGNCSRWTTGGYLLLPGYIVVVGDMELINSIRFLAHFRIFLRKQNKSQSPGEGEQSGEGVLA